MHPVSAGRAYAGAALAQIAFPLGGIGTGTVSLGGRGNLRDWEIFNQPAKGQDLDRTFCALRIAPNDGGPGGPIVRVIEREHLPPFTGALGFQNQRVAGLPRFREARFTGEYPFARIAFEDDAVPADVSLEAFNPFVPMDIAASSIPGAILNYRVRNTGQHDIAVSLLAVMQNPIGARLQPVGYLGPGVDDARFDAPPGLEVTLNAYREGGGLRGVYFTAPTAPLDSPWFGSAALSTPWADTDVQSRLHRGPWWDGLELLWDEFARIGRLTPRLTPAFGDEPRPERFKARWEAGAMCLRARLAPGEEAVLPVFIHWRFDNVRLWGGAGAAPAKTYVGVQFPDAWAAAEHTLANLQELESNSRLWRDTLFGSTLPEPVLDAVATTLSTLRSQTVLRLADGMIYAWEGCGDDEGSCCGNCTHVWNYEQALAFLFPELERTMRRIDFGPNMRPDGAMTFRCDAPIGAGNTTAPDFFACVDGQMGNVMQAYRDWRLSGDEGFLRQIWPNVKRALEYAWIPGGWDPDRDGVMEGCQHNTYDIEFYGPNTMLGSIYLGALRAGEAMARRMGEASAADMYRQVYESGRTRLEAELWNGEHFVQRVEVMDGLAIPRHLQSPGDPSFPKYQYGDGCLSDQLIGQWEAHVCGLGHILDPQKVRRALGAVHRHNFKRRLGDVVSVQRVFGLQDEAGLLLCTWPRGGRPQLPFVYSDEVWTGVEYQVAAHLIYEGAVEEGLEIVAAARARYDGVRRNPWDEIECGHHYARALSSWSLVQALSGAQYDAVSRSLTFQPRLPGPFRCVAAVGSAWGLLSFEHGEAAFEVRHGAMTLSRFGLEGSVVEFDPPRRLVAGDRISAAGPH